jgi:hypothetical protein
MAFIAFIAFIGEPTWMVVVVVIVIVIVIVIVGHRPRRRQRRGLGEAEGNWRLTSLSRKRLDAAREERKIVSLFQAGAPEAARLGHHAEWEGGVVVGGNGTGRGSDNV